jgi:HSP20 family protein
MDPFSKKLLEELEQMQQTGRILRSMSLTRMMPLESGGWQPAMDIYEAEDRIFVYADLAGVTADSLQVTVTDQQLQVSGVRELPTAEAIACIHQLEIELGAFQRTVTLPAVVDVDRVQSAYSGGILAVTLPKRARKGRVTPSPGRSTPPGWTYPKPCPSCRCTALSSTRAWAFPCRCRATPPSSSLTTSSSATA